MKPNPFITQERNKCMDTEGHAPAKTLVIQFHPYIFTTSHWLADFSSFYIYVLSNFSNITIPFISINFPVVSNAWFSKIFRKIDCSNAFFFLHMYFLKIKTYLREITEKFLSTLLLMFLSSCYLIENARRDTAAEKELDILMQIKLEPLLVQRFKKKERDKKSTFQQRHVNVTNRENYSEKTIQLFSLYWHEINFESFSLKSKYQRCV